MCSYVLSIGVENHVPAEMFTEPGAWQVLRAIRAITCFPGRGPATEYEIRAGLQRYLQQARLAPGAGDARRDAQQRYVVKETSAALADISRILQKLRDRCLVYVVEEE